jgi:UDPglucose 6-dehydrogenase
MGTVSVVGAGYVGMVSAACLAERGHDVTVADKNTARIRLLGEGKVPFYEPGLDDLLERSRSRISFTVSTRNAVERSDLTFVSVSTPSRKDGAIDLSQIRSSVREIGRALRSKSQVKHLIVVRSTVVPGTTWHVIRPILERASGLRVGEGLSLAMQPEFLSQGNAIEDMLHPDRIVIGECDNEAGDRLETFYKEFHAGNAPPILRMNSTSAEVVKYAANAFLTMKVSFVNEIAGICERLEGVDVVRVAEAVGLDSRIGGRFLKAGVGFGGSCLPKDIRALDARAEELRFRSFLLPAILRVNDRQKRRVVQLARRLLGSLKGKRVALLGLSFKPDTDDMRGAPSVEIIGHLRRAGAKVVVYDPAAMQNARGLLGGKVSYAASLRECLRAADVCIVVTEWDEFKALSRDVLISEMNRPVLVDGRRMYDPEDFAGVAYAAIGLGPMSGMTCHIPCKERSIRQFTSRA